MTSTSPPPLYDLRISRKITYTQALSIVKHGLHSTLHRQSSLQASVIGVISWMSGWLQAQERKKMIPTTIPVEIKDQTYLVEVRYHAKISKHYYTHTYWHLSYRNYEVLEEDLHTGMQYITLKIIEMEGLA